MIVCRARIMRVNVTRQPHSFFKAELAKTGIGRPLQVEEPMSARRGRRS
jgi:hypothetical protein